MNNNLKKILIFFNDLFLIILTTFFAYILRFESIEIINLLELKNFLIPILSYFFIFFYFSLNNQVIRFFFLSQVNLYIKSNIFYLLISIILAFLLYGYLPRSISVIQPILFFLFFLLSRLIAFYLVNIFSKRDKSDCFLVGINNESLSFINNIDFLNDYKIKFIFESNKDLINRRINNIKIIDIKKLDSFTNKHSPNLIISIINNKQLFRESLKVVTKYEIKMKKIITTKKNHLYSNNFEFENVTISEIFDTKISSKNFGKSFLNKNILVTGAGGSIGSEICRQLVKQKISSITIVDINEFNLFNISKELQSINNKIKINRLLLDLNDYKDLLREFKNKKIDFLFHAAAFKHVGIVEENFVTGFKNNILTTYNILKINNILKIPNFVLISSDKSVRPTNLMGASKRCCELLTYYFHSQSLKNKMSFSVVRFGNVINSSGSVLPIFKKQIEKNQPLTVTHKNVSRYFMTIPQAVNLVLHSSIMSKGLKIYLLDMGKPIKILDLAKKLLIINGLYDRNKNKIRFVGLAQGEKLYEELYKDFKYKKTNKKQIFESIEKIPNPILIINSYKKILRSINNYNLPELKKSLRNELISYEYNKTK